MHWKRRGESQEKDTSSLTMMGERNARSIDMVGNSRSRTTTSLHRNSFGGCDPNHCRCNGNKSDNNNLVVSSWFDDVSVPIFAVHRSGKITAWNQKTAEITGYCAKEMIGASFDLILHDNAARRTWERALERSSYGFSIGSNCAVDVLTKEGVSCRLLLRLSSQKSNCTYGSFCSIEEIRMRIPSLTSSTSAKACLGLDADADITDGESALDEDFPGTEEEEEGPEVEDENHKVKMDIDFLSFIENSPIPMFAVDRVGTLNAWNAKCSELTGFSKHEALMNHALDYFITNKKEQEKVRELINSSVSGTESTINIGFLTKDGRRLYLSLSSTALRSSSDDKEICGVVIYVLNETESSKQVHSTASLSKLVDAVPAPVFGVDVHGNIDLWNAKAERLSEYHSINKNALNKPILQSLNIVPEQHVAFQELLKNAYAGMGTSAYELECTTEANETRYLLVNVGTRRDDNTITGALVVAQDVTKAAQEQRVETGMARELRQLFDTANAPIFGVDCAGSINEWNDKTVELTGIPADEAFHKNMTELLDPHQLTNFQDVLDRALQGRGTSNYEVEINTKSNKQRFVLANITPRTDLENRIIGAVVFAHDITEASIHNRAVASMASELRQLIDTANAPIFGIDCDGDVNEWNDKTAEITGFTKEEALDCSLLETFIAPYMRDSVRNVLDNALEGKGTSNYELECRTKSNDIRHLLVNATTRRDAQNNVVGVVGVAQDVTEAVQRDRAVAGMAQELRQLIDTANAPIFGIDSDGNVNEWNRRTEDITGYSKEEAFDEPFVGRFIAPSMQAKVQEILDAALEGNETSNYELEFVSKTGEAKFMSVNATTRRDPENNVVGVVGVAQDVTEDRKNAQALREMQYLRASQEAKVETERNMTAYFAHELRNPLGAIISALEAMPDDLPQSVKSLLDGMQLCSSFMLSIMNNLLDVRKMEEGKMTLYNAPISLNYVLSGVYRMLHSSVRPSVEFIKVCNTEGKDWVLGDAHRIQQVMTNVITNAIKYTTKGSVTIMLGWEGDNVRFECVDTGPGIPKSEQAQLFERFTKRGGAPGTGLGLAIAKHLVDLAGGSIRFDSDPSVRAGTSCVVLFPLPQCDPPGKSEQVESTALIEQPLRFLIIDDIKMNRMMLKRRITKGIAPNAVISQASNGEEALEICATENFDVIIVDQYMEEAGGVMVGTDVVFALRRMRVGSIIIGCSGNDMATAFEEAGADLVWQKPMPTNAQIIEDLRSSLSKQVKL